MFPIMTSSPYLAFSQIEFGGILPFCSSPRNSHEWVVCNLFSLLRKTETTFGCSALHKEPSPVTHEERSEKSKEHIQRSPVSVSYLPSQLLQHHLILQQSHWCVLCTSKRLHLQDFHYYLTIKKKCYQTGYITKVRSNVNFLSIPWLLQVLSLDLPKNDPRNSWWYWVTRFRSTDDTSGPCECAPK